MEAHLTPENPTSIHSAMPPAHDPIPGNIPASVECASCGYNLAGLPWGGHCPECGYRAPTTYPTTALREAHPDFIRSTRNQLRCLIVADTALIASLALGMIAYVVAVTLYPMSERTQVVRLSLMVGLIGITIGLLVILITAGSMSRRHPYARTELDQPLRKALSTAFWWCVGPLGVGLGLTFVSGGIAGCVLLVGVPISLLASGVLAYFLFEQNSSLIKRCKQDPDWTFFQSLLGYGSVLVFALSAITIAVLPVTTIPFAAAGIAMLVLAHVQRTKTAERCVRLVQAESHQPASET